VLLLIAVMVIVKAVGGGKDAPAAIDNATLPASVLAALTGVPAASFDRVGIGSVDALPRPLAGQPALVRDGKPLVVYIGAEYCPFCASQRWGIVVALARFGTFSGLSASRSASDDVYPDTPTVSFHGAGYTSAYLAFEGVETHRNTRAGSGYAVLDPLTDQHRQLLATYNRPPHVEARSAGSIPFVDFGNRYLHSGASFSPDLLAGASVADLAARLADPADPLAQAILGSANAFTTVLCDLTGGQPAAVCGSAGANAYKGKLDAS
jgi:hypothetical protein